MKGDSEQVLASISPISVQYDHSNIKDEPLPKQRSLWTPKENNILLTKIQDRTLNIQQIVELIGTRTFGQVYCKL